MAVVLQPYTADVTTRSLLRLLPCTDIVISWGYYGYCNDQSGIMSQYSLPKSSNATWPSGPTNMSLQYSTNHSTAQGQTSIMLISLYVDGLKKLHKSYYGAIVTYSNYNLINTDDCCKCFVCFPCAPYIISHVGALSLLP